MKQKLITLFFIFSILMPFHSLLADQQLSFKDIFIDSELAIDENDTLNKEQTFRKVKKICKLCVGCLAVTDRLFVNAIDYSNLSTLAGALANTGLIAATGPTGATGATGAGLPGSTGPTGATGSLASAYGFFYFLRPSNAAVGAGTAFIFPVDGVVPVGITRDPGSPDSDFVLATAGIYQIIWQANISYPNQIEMAVGINGIEQPNSRILGSLNGQTPTNNQLFGNIIINADAGDIVTIRAATNNVSPITNPTLIGGNQSYAGTLTIIQIA